MEESTKKPLVKPRDDLDIPMDPNAKSSRDVRDRLRPWLFDVLSLLLGVIGLTTTIALLWSYDNKPLPKWQFVTFNAILSVLAQITKASLASPLAEIIGQLKWHWFSDMFKPQVVADFNIYDAACRGPYGAFVMLAKRRMWGIASLGALLTILVAATETFLQSLPAYPTRYRLSNETATIATTTFYSDTSVETHERGLEAAAATFALGAATKGAFFSGLYNSNSGSSIIPACSSGNCTWDQYSSLGVCTACASITHLLNSTLEPGLDNMQMMWTAPNGFQGYSGDEWLILETDLPTIMFKQLQAYSIVDLFQMEFSSSSELAYGTPRASECMLYFCVKTYSGSVQDGTLDEETVSVFPNVTTPSDVALSAFHMPNHQSNCTATNQTGDCQQSPLVSDLHPKGAVYNPGSDPKQDQASQSPLRSYDGNVSITDPATTQSYKINVPTLTLAREWMQSMLSASVSHTTTGQSAGDVAQLFLYVAEPDQIMSRIAGALTAQLRNSGGQHARGHTLIGEPFVHVRWGWLILPVAVLIFTILLLATTVLLSLKRQVPVWKSSSIPTLLYSLDKDTVAAIGQSGPRINKLEEKAEQYSMAVSNENRNWHLGGFGRQEPSRLRHR